MRPDWLERGSRGFEGGSEWQLVSHSSGKGPLESQRFAVIKIPGRSYFADRITGSVYGAVEYWIVRKDDVWRSNRKLRIGGRPTLKEKDQWRRYLSMAEETGVINVPELRAH